MEKNQTHQEEGKKKAGPDPEVLRPRAHQGEG
jgi:hypothetical protein